MVQFASYIGDGKQVITAAQDGIIRVWDAETGKEMRRFSKQRPADVPVAPPAPNPKGAAAARILLAPRVSNVFTCATLTPDGKGLATGAQDGTITLWEIETGKEIRSWKQNPANGIFALVFAPDGKTLVAKSYNQWLVQFNTEDGKELRKFTFGSKNTPQRREQPFYGNNQGTSVTFLDQGKTVAAAMFIFENNQVIASLKRWEAETGKELEPLMGPKVPGFQGMAVSSDGKTSAWSVNDGTIRLWDLAAGKELHQVGGPQDGGFPMAMNFTADGKLLATRGQDQLVRVWNVETGKQAKVLGGEANGRYYGGFAPGNLAFSADNKRVLTGTSGMTIRQWDVTTGEEKGGAVGHHGAVAGLGLSSDGNTAITRSYNDNTIRVWDTRTGKEQRHFDVSVGIALSAFSADGRTLAVTGYDGSLRAYDLTTGKELAREQGKPTIGFQMLALSPDGKTAATRGYDQTIRLWDTATGREIRQLAPMPAMAGGPAPGNIQLAKAPFPMVYSAPVLAFSPDGSTLAATNGGGRQYLRAAARADFAAPVNAGPVVIGMWDVGTGKLVRRFEPARVGMTTFAFAPDTRTLASANYDGTISLWESASGKERFNFKALPQQGSVSMLTYSPDGRMLTGVAPDQTVRFWDAVTGKELKSFTTGHTSGLSSLALAGDGKTLATGGNDTTGLVFEVGSIKPEDRPQPVAIDSAQAEALWTALSGDDAKKAYEAIRALAAAPAQALPLVREQIKAVPPLDPKKMAQLMADLDSNQFGARQRATEELEKLAELAEPDLRKVIKGQPSLELRMRVERLLERLVNVAPPTAEELRALRALEVLEQLGTPEARQAIEALTKGAAGARLTRFAQLTLNRVQSKS
jgi:WD40 repeat protein